MAVGDLSPDQARFTELVTAGTGLNPAVVTSWVGTESGWAIHKPDHNYLNIGPGRSYASVDQAAAATVDLIRTSNHYGGIVAATVQSPAAQIEAIGASPWGTIKTTLADVYSDLREIRVVDGHKATPVDWTIPGWVPGVGGDTIDTPDAGDVAKAIQEPLARAAAALTSQALNGALSLVFTLAAISLIGFGLYHVTSKPRDVAKDQAGNLVGDVKKTVDILSFATPAGAAGKAAKLV